MTPEDKNLFHALRAQADEVQVELQRLIPLVAEARRAYFKSRTQRSRDELSAIEQRAADLGGRLTDIVGRMRATLEVSDEELEALEREGRPGDPVSRVRRDQLTVDKVDSTASIETALGSSFEKLLAMVGPHRLKHYAALPPPSLMDSTGDAPLSLVRGVRPESEHPQIHRFAQAILVARDFLEQNPRYDHFAGALLVPQIARLSERLELLHDIPGAEKRLKSLWRRTSAEVDSTIFELLVGAGCASHGRSVEFLDAGSTKTPDLMCHDPYPIAIECKRKRVLATYEIDEEKCMRALFSRLEVAARGAGMWGRFVLELSVEAQHAPLDEIVASLMMQRYSGGRGNFIEFGWGKVVYLEAPARIRLPRPTRLYSPNMLQAAFDWDSDLAEFDGLICRVANALEPVVDSAERAVALLWSNVSAQALKKRSWGPMSAVTEALDQIPTGDFGIVYVAYQEGAREEMADSRTFGFADWLKEIRHREEIRVPVCKLVRLYPRALGDGAPDLIESTVQFLADYSDTVLPTLFPSTVFTDH
jgi:hypothetical protein